MGTLAYERKNSWEAALLKAGLGYIGYRASEELQALEAAAKAAKLKVWENYDEKAAGSDEATLAEDEFLEAEISHITEAGSFHVHVRR